MFDTSGDAIEIIGTHITVNGNGTQFTLNRTGLYRIEWSINLGSGTPPIIVGILENGQPVSAMSNATSAGNYSSGTLIKVGPNDAPVTISLHNFGGPIELVESTGASNSAASIRITRFADGSST